MKIGSKVIQIATMPADKGSAQAWALCEDGTIWVYNIAQKKWFKLESLPG